MKKISVLRKSKAYKIYNELCSRLDNNIYSKHLPMPAASAIAAEFGVSVGTANQALRLLADENRVIRKIGSGTYPAKFIKQPRIACLLQDMLVSQSLDNWSSHWIVTQQIMQTLQKANCTFKVFSYLDLLQNYFSPRLLNEFDALIADSAFSDDNSRKMIFEFKGPRFVIGNVFPDCNPGCQIVPDFTPALVELLQQARYAGVKKLLFHLHREQFQTVFKNAALLANYNPEDYEIMPLCQCNLMSAYRQGQLLEASREIFHICSSDTLAAGFYQAFIDRGLQPGEFAVSGSGNNEEFGFLPLNGKHLTTISSKQEIYTQKIVDILFESLKSGCIPQDIVRLTTQLVKRDSTFF